MVCFLLLGYYNRFASDDFEFLIKLREYGFAGSVKWFHEHWNTRWSAIALLNASLLFTVKSGSLIWYHLFSIGMLWWAFYRIIRNITVQPKLSDSIFAGYAAVAFFYCCFSISDVFFWINTSCMYLFGCIALLFAIAEITAKKHTTGSYLRLAAFGLFLAGAYEPLVFTCMVSCLVVLTVLVYRHHWNVWRLPFDKKVIIFLSAMMLGFAISYSGEGHVVRSTFLPQHDFGFKFWVWIKALIKMFGMHAPSKLLLALMFSLPWFLFGTGHNLVWFTADVLKKITSVFLLLIMISLLPVAFIMSEMGPERAWTQISVYIVIYAGFLACYAGRALKNKYDINYVTKLYIFISALYILATGITKVVEAKKYSSAYDARMENILNHRDAGKKEVLVLSPIPDAGWFHSAEISSDSTFYNNTFLKNFLKLDFEIVSGQVAK